MLTKSIKTHDPLYKVAKIKQSVIIMDKMCTNSPTRRTANVKREDPSLVEPMFKKSRILNSLLSIGDSPPYDHYMQDFDWTLFNAGCRIISARLGGDRF